MNNESLVSNISILDENLHVLIGHDLKSFLNSGLITPGNIATLLKRNGIYIPTRSKHAVSVLSSMILSPEIFNQMIDFVDNKEQRPKYRTGSVELFLDSQTNWKDSLQDNLENLESIDINDIFGNVEYEKLPILAINGSIATLMYELRRKDYSQDLLKRNMIVKGIVQIKENKGKLEIVSTFTSKETEELNKILIENISKTFYAQGIITQESITQIKFKDFTNEKRIKFFNELVAGNKELKNGSLETLEIMIDEEESVNLPDDPEVDFLRGSFKGLKTLGEAELNESFFIKNVKYYPYYFIPLMDVKYDFTSGANKGSCIVEFFFKSIKNTYSESVLDFSLSEPRYEKSIDSAKVRRDIQLWLYEEVQKMIEQALKKHQL